MDIDIPEEMELDLTTPNDPQIALMKDPRYQQILDVCLGILKYGVAVPISDLITLCASRNVATERDEIFHVLKRLSNCNISWRPRDDALRWIDTQIIEDKGWHAHL